MEYNTKVIAEAGVNHNGSVDLAKELISKAADAGADYIKFQTFKTDLNISSSAQKANYQKLNTGKKNETQYEMVKKLELSFSQFEELSKYCKQSGIGFLSTAFDYPSLDFIAPLCDYLKCGSGEITNLPFLQELAKHKKPILLSTGMSDLGEIEDALDVLMEAGTEKANITALHCNTDYPTPMEDVNLWAMNTIQKAFNVAVGYSDHTMGTEIPICAAALGASIVEKHFTLDRSMEGPDHKASLEPEELKAMVKAIRNVGEALGNGIKKPSSSELKNKPIARKSLHLKTELSKDHQIRENDLSILRPGDGISPMEIHQVIGRQINKDLPAGHQLKLKDLS